MLSWRRAQSRECGPIRTLKLSWSLLIHSTHFCSQEAAFSQGEIYPIHDSLKIPYRTRTGDSQSRATVLFVLCLTEVA